MHKKIQIDQKSRTPITSLIGLNYSFRYGYERSADSIAANTEGQDYLAIQYDETRIAFVLCDGVSQSFFGDIAARILGDSLVDWFWNQEGITTYSELGFESKLVDFLNRLTVTARAQVQQFRLPDGLALMLPEVLEKKRTLGSEATFVAGVVDLVKQMAHFAWMGDSRLRVWDENLEVSSHLLGDGNFLTKERWSSHRGCIGSLHTAIVSLSQINRCVLYSDGLAKLDKKVGKYIPTSGTLEQIIEDARHFPASDDVSYLEIFIGSRPDWGKPQPRHPAQFRVELDPEKQIIRTNWRSSQDVTLYELAEITSMGWRIHESTKPGIIIGLNRQLEKTLLFSVRSWVNGNCSPWSRFERIELGLGSTTAVGVTPPPLQPYPITRQTPPPQYLSHSTVLPMARHKHSSRPIFLTFLAPLLFIALIIILAFSSNGNKETRPVQLTKWARMGTEVTVKSPESVATETPTVKPTKTPRLKPQTHEQKKPNELEIENGIKNQRLTLWEWIRKIFKKKTSGYFNSTGKTLTHSVVFIDDYEVDLLKTNRVLTQQISKVQKTGEQGKNRFAIG